MLNGRRQAGIGLTIAGAAAVLTYVSAAFACGPVASITLGSSAAPPGAQVNGTGNGFSNSHGGAPSAEPVVVHWDSRTGPVLWSGRPDATGAISFTFTVPSATPGDHSVIATQTNADGTPAPGTPARAVLTVLEPPPTTTTSTTTTTTTTVAAPPSSSPPVEAATAPTAAASSVPPSAAPTTVAPVRQTATRPAPARQTVTSTATAPPPTDAIAVTAPPTTTPATSVAAPTDTSAPSATALAAREAFSDDGGSGTGTPVLLGVVLLGSLAASVGGMRRARARRSE